MTDNLNKIEEGIERLLNLTAGLDIPLPAEIHLEQLRQLLPEITGQLREGLVEAGGEDLWPEL